MTIVTVGGIVLLAVVLACVVVLYRRGRNTGSARRPHHGRSASELDAQARSASARASDRQGTGPF
jgi:hypothetical protein